MKKVRNEPVMMRQAWITKEDDVAIFQQYVMSGVSRATFYARQHPNPVDESDILISRLIDEEYTKHPYLWHSQDGDICELLPTGQ